MIQSDPHLINSLRNNFVETLLMHVVRYDDDDDDVFDHLLDLPQDFNVVNDDGRDIIHWIAFSSDDGRGARRLIKLSNKMDVGSLINKQDNDGDTPLHFAAGENNHQTIKQLLDLGCDVNIKNNDDELPDEDYYGDEVTKELIRQAR